jgi:hypothetical protein
MYFILEPAVILTIDYQRYSIILAMNTTIDATINELLEFQNQRLPIFGV